MDTIEKIEKLAKEISMQNIEGYIGITPVDCAYRAYLDYLEKNNLPKDDILSYTNNQTLHEKVCSLAISETLYEKIYLELIFKNILENGINENNINALEDHRTQYNEAAKKLINFENKKHNKK